MALNLPDRVLGSSRQFRIALVLCVLTTLFFLALRNASVDLTIPVKQAILGSSKVVVRDRVAVLIENRPTPKLAPLVLHFQSVLGPDWPILLFVTSELFNLTSLPLKREIARGNIGLRELPADVSFHNHTEVSRFLAQPWLWEQLAPAKHVLHFQMDSVLCADAPHMIDEFLQYDLVGAPLKVWPGWGSGYNGGLSLRNRELSLKVTRENNWEQEVASPPDDSNWFNPVFPDNPNPPQDVFEDQWFFRKFVQYGANLPDFDTANLFSSESIRIKGSLGYHKPNAQVAEWCPEAKLVVTEQFSTPY